MQHDSIKSPSKSIVVAVLVVVWLILIIGSASAATYIGSLPGIPANSQTHLNKLVGKILFIGVENASGFNLACYNTYTDTQLWTADILGGSSSGMHQPYEVTMSDSGSYVYVSLFDSNRLFQLDIVDGSILSSYELNDCPRYLDTKMINGQDSLIVTTDSEMYIFDAEFIGAPLYQGSFSGGELGGIDFIESAGNLVMYATFSAPDLLIRFDIQRTSVITVTSLSANTDLFPYTCFALDNGQVAVCCTQSGTVNIFNGQTLAPVTTYAAMGYLQHVKYIDGWIVMAGRTPGQFLAKFGVLDPTTGVYQSFTRSNSEFGVIEPSSVNGVVHLMDAGYCDFSHPHDWFGSTMHTVNLVTCSIMSSVPLAGGSLSCQYGDISSHVYVVDSDGTVKIYTSP